VSLTELTEAPFCQFCQCPTLGALKFRDRSLPSQLCPNRRLTPTAVDTAASRSPTSTGDDQPVRWRSVRRWHGRAVECHEQAEVDRILAAAQPAVRPELVRDPAEVTLRGELP
jgi:hypothetical protein